MLRFAFVSTMGAYPWGGSEELWSSTARILAGRGHEVHASVLRWPIHRPQLDSLRAAGVEVAERPGTLADAAARLAAGMAGHRRNAVLRNLTHSVWLGWGRGRWLDRVRPDLVCVSSGNVTSGAPWLEACLRRGIPYVSLAHANSESWWPDDELTARLRPLMSAARGCFFVAGANLRLFEDQLGCPLPNAEIVRNPYDEPKDGALPWPDLPRGEVRLASVARLNPAAKGQDLVLHVLALPAWRDRNVTVSFFGDDRYGDGLRRLADSLGVADRVRFPGLAPADEIWSGHHALVLTSRYEGLPLVIAEALARGRPAIVTDVGGNAELVREGETGFVAPAPTVSFVADALERAWSRRDEWPLIGAEAARRIREAIPADPAATFADRLEELCRNG